VAAARPRDERQAPVDVAAAEDADAARVRVDGADADGRPLVEAQVRRCAGRQ